MSSTPTPAPTLVRVGLGTDGHPLVAGRPCVIGGVRIEHPSGPAGHSDGDPVLHALADALYGAVAAGDIGTRFPDSDPAHAGAASSAFVEDALAQVRAAGLEVVNVDAVVQCDAPRIGPHREAMRARIAELCGVEVGRVSVKAKSLQAAPGLTGVHAQVVVLLGPG